MMRSYTSEELLLVREQFFGCFALDMLEMMKLMNENNLVNRLQQMQTEVLELLRSKEPFRPSSFISTENVLGIIDEYRELIHKNLLHVEI